MKEKNQKWTENRGELCRKIKELGKTLSIKTMDLSLKQNEMDSTFTVIKSEK